MNRIEHTTKPAKEVSADSTFSLESGLFALASHDSSFALFAPKHYEPNYAYPLIVWLHSPGGDERQLMRIMPIVSLRNYVAVAPRGFLTGGPRSGQQGYQWPQTEDHIYGAACRVFEGITAVQQKFHVADARIFLAGFGLGGTMAFRVAMDYPNRFGGVLSICGAFPSQHAPLGRLIQARRLPVFLAVGRDSREYPPANACEDLRLFHTAGVSVTLRQYPCDQQLTHQMLRDVDRWIIEQITTPQPAGAEPDNGWLCPPG